MRDHVQRTGMGDGRSPTDLRLLGNPLDFISEEHMREREMCALIDRITTDADGRTEDMQEVLSFLESELPLHLQDEEEDLFSLMLRRCQPEDEIDKVIGRLRSDHGHSMHDTPAAAEILKAALGARGTLSEQDRDALRDYAGHSRRHLILENAVILPIARARLLAEDLEEMRAHMIARRQAGPGGEAHDAG